MGPETGEAGANDGRLPVAKDDLRTALRRRRRGIPAEERVRRAVSVADRLLGLPEVSGARTIMLFSSFGTELPTGPAIEALWVAGARVLLPYLEAGDMAATEHRPGDRLVATGYGPQEPARRVAVPPVEIDVVVTPGLAFDRKGRRLGYGGGFYDRYLPKVRQDTVKIGIGFAEQLIESVPGGDLDVMINVVVTDAEVVRCRPPVVG